MHIKRSVSCSLFFLILIFTAPACLTLEGERTFSKNSLTVTFRSLNRFGYGIKDYTIQHPITISNKLIKNHLLALWYRKINQPGKKAKPVFSLNEIEDLCPLIMKAFRKTNPGKYLHFKFQSSRGMISGDVFASVKKIHWRFLKINGVDYSNDPLRLRAPTWQLVRTRGQTYHKTAAANLLKKPQKNWILANLKLPKTKRSQEALSKSNAPKKNGKMGKSKLRLKTLKKFFKEGLIDEEEYQKKKNEIMDQIF